MIWVSAIFNETEKNHDSVILKKSSSMESKLEFTGKDIGYYKVYMPEFTKENVFVQILDKNLVHHEKIGVIVNKDMIIDEKTKVTIDELKAYNSNWLTNYMSS